MAKAGALNKTLNKPALNITTIRGVEWLEKEEKTVGIRRIAMVLTAFTLNITSEFNQIKKVTQEQ
ncbi:hypothetical protein [Limnohabitans lacus]|uniref:Uncharacterized protein n=1 Tax=Limnohabitans lacus TaxID=3045173 RepID=A0ABT6X556_9BURK|nr:hypothetical protein [Limnohabitans sp. HM2-2]MDI9233233.1 hypothetical protein [Limnohabitans sp. HM2-2]